MSSTKGGAIHNTQQSTMTIGDEVIFSSNTSVSSGGAIYNVNSSSMTIGKNAVFSSNTAGDHAGAISNQKSSMIIGSGVTFSSNAAVISAGALYNGDNGLVEIGDESIFEYNSAGNDGGALYNIGRSTLTIGNNTIISYNTAGNRGGGLFTGTNSVSKIGDGVVFSSNVANTGGAIHNIFNVEIGSGAVFSYNTAVSSGGAVHNTQGATMTIGENAVFHSNSAKYGGTVYNSDNGIIEFGDGVVFSSNSANSSGGALYNVQGSTITIGKNAVFSSNLTKKYAGAISSQNSFLEIGSGVSFSSNVAVNNAGALYNGNAGLVEIAEDASFLFNTAGVDGGAIFNIGRSTFTIGNNALISHNTAGARGGGLFTGTYSLSKIGDGVIFSSNVANTGGAIHNIFNVEIGSGAVFSYNTAVSSGGAVHNTQGATMTIGENAVFHSNSAKYGGAIYNVQGSTITIGDGVIFSSNSAEYGGAIYLDEGVINMENPVFTGNEAEKLGGAVYIEGENGKVEMNIKITKDIEVSGNTADKIDNVFYLAKEAELKLDIDSGTTLNLKDGVMSENDNTAITKTGEGLLFLDSENNRIDGILNIFGGEIKTGYSIGCGNIFFDNSALLHITDDIEMKNEIYAKNGGVQDITIETDGEIKLTMSGIMGIGNETLNKNGTGSMIFDTASSTNLLKTNLTEGTLRVLTDDYVSKNVEVSYGATLNGTGKITGDVINKGVVIPGGETSIGTLTIDGNYTENGILGIRLYQNEIPTNNLLLVYGKADIDKASKIDLDLRYGFRIGEEYTILTSSSGVSGIYDGFVNDLSSFDILISSDTNNVYLKLDGINTNYSSLSNLSHNQKEVSKTIDKITNGTDKEIENKISNIIGTAESLDEEGKKAVFDEIAGSIYANMLYASADNSWRKQIYNQITKKINRDLDREKQTTCTYNLWGQIYGSHIIRDTDSNSINKFTDDSAYAMIGWDNYCGEDNVILGYVAEFGKHKGKQGDDEFEMNDYKGGIYFGTFGKRWNFKSSLTGGYQQYEVDREQNLLQTTTESEYAGYSINAAADLYYTAYQTVKGNFSLSPFGGLEGSFVYTDAFKEKAKGNAASWLDVKENNFVIADAKLGFRVENISKLSWYAELSGKYNLTGEKGTFNAKINGVGDDIEIYGLKNGKISGKMEAGLDLKIGNHFDIFLVGICEQAEKFGKYSGHIGVNYGW